MTDEQNMLIPEEMLASKGVSRVRDEGEEVLLRNETMYTFYRHTAGEFSEFFIALADRCEILGARCPSCGVVNCPPHQRRCPECNFVEMEKVIMKDTGRMNYAPVITLFPHARFKDEVPFATGYVFLETEDGEADTCLPVRCRATRGMIQPGVFEKHEPVKVVFRDERDGGIRDLFVVPQSELTRAQLAKSPLMESDLDWESPKEPEFKATGENDDNLEEVHYKFCSLSDNIRQSGNAAKALLGWNRVVDIKTASNQTLRLMLEGGYMAIHYYSNAMGPSGSEADLVLAIEDPRDLLPYLERGVALSNLVMEGKLWVSKPELETIFRLDRLPRALQKDGLWPL